MKLQQGDVILRTINELPKSAIKAETQVVKAGINNHTISESGVVFTDGDKTFVSTVDASILSHPEHGPITVPVGVYSVGIKKEYDHQLEESREVVD